MKNKYSDVGIALGNLADWMRNNAHSIPDDAFHAILRRMLGILEDQAEEIETLRRKIKKLEQAS